MDRWKYNPATDLNTPHRLRSHKRESGLLGLLARNTWFALVRAYFALGQKIKVEGRQNLPATLPFLLVANHNSHLDALLLASVLPLKLRNKVFPIAAGDTFFETPILSAFAAGAMNALPLWRKNAGHHAMNDLRQRLLAEPCGYILFPEGTRSRDGSMTKFRAGVGMLVAQSSVPVIPCHIEGTHHALPPNKKFPRRSKITLKIGTPLSFPAIPNTREGWTQIAQSLESAIRSLNQSGADAPVGRS